VHPTQKPEALLARVILSSTRPGDTILDPFFGTGTTGAVAKRLGRHFVGIEREDDYIEAARARIDAVEPLDSLSIRITAGKRAEPRIPFTTLIEAGLLTPGTELTDARGRYSALVRADGTIATGTHAASIHRVGAQVQGVEACNGWTFWHVREGGKLRAIDELRKEVRARMGTI